MQVVKRTGELVTFDERKITSAIAKALAATSECNTQDIVMFSDIIMHEVLQDLKPGEDPVPIELIQDTVEKGLMKKEFFITAKAYILYRNKRSEERAASTIVKSNSDLQKLVAESSSYFNHEIVREFVYYRTYSRWIESKGRREVWSETVDRYMSFMRETLTDKLDENAYHEVREAILKNEVMPSMRLLQFAGDAARRCNVCVYNCSFTAPENFKELAEVIYLSMSGTGVGFSVESKHVDKFPIIKIQSEEKSHFVVDDSKEGWAESFEYGLQKWYDGEDVVFDYSRLRPAGARLKTMGGRSSGPGPLKELHEFTRELVFKKQGSKLTTLNMHDIICKIGQIVVAGGQRRSALLSLSDLNDHEIRDAKKGNFWSTDSQRCLANNSAVYNTKPSMIEFMHEWLALAESGSGERGIFNRGGLAKMLPQRRLDVLGQDVHNLGPNPCCVSGDTWVLTEEGAFKARTLVGKDVKLVVNGFRLRTKMQANGKYGFFPTGVKKTFMLITKKGYSVVATADHCFLIENNSQREKWIPLSDLKEGDRIRLSKQFSSASNADQKWKGLGGSMEDGYHDAINDFPVSGSYFFSGTVDEKYEMQSTDYYIGFLKGILISSNVPVGSNTLTYSIWYNEGECGVLIPIIQRMLSRLGIVSTVSTKQKSLKDSTIWKMSITLEDCGLVRFSELIGDDFGGKLALPVITTDDIFNEYTDEVYIIDEYEEMDVYDVTIDSPPGMKIHEFCANGIRAHNCEINLKPMEFCNLSEVICRPDDTEESLLRKIRVATIIGTYQSTLTKFGYINDRWRLNQEQERLLGVSLTGQWDCPAVRGASIMEKLRDYSIIVNRQYALQFGVAPSTAITAVKPSGTVSQLTNTSSGMHARFAPYYIRRIRISASDPLLRLMKDQGYDVHPEVGQVEPSVTTYVLDFYVKSPEGAICTKDLTGLQQLEYAKMVKLNYTEHNPSVTIYVKEDEWMSDGQWIWDNWETVTGLSFFPRSDHVYQLAPYEEISKEDYEEAIRHVKRVDFSELTKYESSDTTDVKREVACAGGICDL